MQPNPTATTSYATLIRAWMLASPWYRRAMARLGLQGKLIIGFSLLIALSTSASCWLYLTESTRIVAQHTAERAMQMAHTLAMASETPLRRADYSELDRVGKDLLKNVDLAAVGFFNTDGQPLSLACRDPEIDRAHPSFLAFPESHTTHLMRPLMQRTRVLGDFVKVTAPVLMYAAADGSPSLGKKLGGYVTVCLSDNEERAQLRKIQWLQVFIGGITLAIVVPLVYALVLRVFHPIRQLVAAADRIARGDLEARVAIHRPDVIGTLARSFNEMVLKVKAQQENLEHKVQQRTAQLETANRRLSAEIAEKEDFLRAVSHDLNAPLRNIAGMANSLLTRHGEKLDEDVVHRLHRIQKNCDTERDLINELLELSRIKTTRQRFEMVDLHAMVHDLAGMFESDLKTRGISLQINGLLPVIYGEKSRLRQLFQNLIDNAIKYMGDGTVREIHVGARVDSHEAEFYVSDTGIGIEPDDLDKVFYVFRRGKNVHAHQVSGKGVGLANVKSIVETYNGKIWVESTRGQGSTFRFTINGQFVPESSRTDVRSRPPSDPRHQPAAVR